MELLIKLVWVINFQVGIISDGALSFNTLCRGSSSYTTFIGGILSGEVLSFNTLYRDCSSHTTLELYPGGVK